MQVNKNLLLSVVATVSVVGTFIIIGSGAIRIGDIFGALKGINPRLMGLLALPFIVVFFLVGKYLLKKNEERKWKNALLKTRAAKQKEAARKD
jgi:hypothetical protein